MQDTKCDTYNSCSEYLVRSQNLCRTIQYNQRVEVIELLKDGCCFDRDCDGFGIYVRLHCAAEMRATIYYLHFDSKLALAISLQVYCQLYLSCKIFILQTKVDFVNTSPMFCSVNYLPCKIAAYYIPKCIGLRYSASESAPASHSKPP